MPTFVDNTNEVYNVVSGSRLGFETTTTLVYPNIAELEGTFTSTGPTTPPAPVVYDSPVPTQPGLWREVAIDWLLAQFYDRPRFRALLEVLLDELQELDVALYEVGVARRLSEAENIHLDRIGVALGLDRYTGQADGEYRSALQAAAVARVSRGARPDFVAFTDAVTGDDSAEVQAIFPATLRVVLDAGVSLDAGGQLAKICGKAYGLGINGALVYQPTDAAALVVSDHPNFTGEAWPEFGAVNPPLLQERDPGS